MYVKEFTSTAFSFVYGPPDVVPRCTLYPSAADVLAFQLRTTELAAGGLGCSAAVRAVGGFGATEGNGMYSSAVDVVVGLPVHPPVTSTVPSLSSVAVAPLRATFKLPVVLKVPLIEP